MSHVHIQRLQRRPGSATCLPLPWQPDSIHEQIRVRHLARPGDFRRIFPSRAPVLGRSSDPSRVSAGASYAHRVRCKGDGKQGLSGLIKWSLFMCRLRPFQMQTSAAVVLAGACGGFSWAVFTPTHVSVVSAQGTHSGANLTCNPHLPSPLSATEGGGSQEHTPRRC